MGINFSTYSFLKNVTGYVTGKVTGKKRRHSESDEEQNDKVVDVVLHTPKRKKLESTANYIYQALFVTGTNSDVTVRALGEEFRLHKVYLSQSPYFASMFGGSWLETTKKYITIDIVDPTITQSSLKVVLGSLYNFEISLNPKEIIPILATATMFQLDGLIDKCAEVMQETINPKTALDYYNAASQYSNKKVRDVCFKWFLMNLMTYYHNKSLSELRTIPISLLSKLVAHPDLVVIQTDYSVYVMLKFWVYLQLFPEGNVPSLKTVNEYFSSRPGRVSFLRSSDGKQFNSAFRGLRLRNMFTHQFDVQILKRDNIIPHTQLDSVLASLWTTILRVNQNKDKGPNEFPREMFLASSMRCGMVLPVKEKQCWRWTGFHFGIDLVMISEGSNISIKRNNRTELDRQLLSLQTTRHIAIRLTVIKLNEQRQIVYTKQTDIMKVSLTKGEEIQIMSLDDNIDRPIIISANILFTSPNTEEIPADEMR
nr:protein germ cell-less-like [Leptinotarsa decemlineata]